MGENINKSSKNIEKTNEKAMNGFHFLTFHRTNNKLITASTAVAEITLLTLTQNIKNHVIF